MSEVEGSPETEALALIFVYSLREATAGIDKISRLSKQAPSSESLFVASSVPEVCFLKKTVR